MKVGFSVRSAAKDGRPQEEEEEMAERRADQKSHIDLKSKIPDTAKSQFCKLRVSLLLTQLEIVDLEFTIGKNNSPFLLR